MLEKEFQYYLDHQEELVKKYDNRYLVIADEEVVGNYDSFANAVSEAEQKYEVGTFLVQKCSEGEKNYTVKYHSLPVTGNDLGDTDMLIGIDIISKGDFAITNVDGKTVLSFRIPSVETIDFVRNNS